MCKTKSFLLVFILLFLTLGMKIECRRKPTKKMVLDKCAKRMEIKFPPSTHLVNFAEDWDLDYSACVRIEIDENDLQAFIDNSPFAGKRLEARSNLSAIGPAKWWEDHESVQNLKSGQVRLQSGGPEGLSILTDLDKPGKAVVYLEYMGRPIIFQDE